MFLSLTLTACAPVPFLQGAETLGQGSEDQGLGVLTMIPLREGTSVGPMLNEEIEDLNEIPLPAVFGWYRKGMGLGEIQASFQLTSFTMDVGYKAAFVGGRPSDTLSMAVSVHVSSSPPQGQVGAALALYTTVRPTPKVALELMGRVGTFPGLWSLPVVTVGGGVALGRDKPWRLHGGAVIDPGLGGTPGAWFGVSRAMSAGP